MVTSNFKISVTYKNACKSIGYKVRLQGYNPITNKRYIYIYIIESKE